MIRSSYKNDTDNKYLYNGKKLQYELDLEWYNYGARIYAEYGVCVTVKTDPEGFSFNDPNQDSTNENLTQKQRGGHLKITQL